MTGAEAGAAGMTVFAGASTAVDATDVNVWHMNPIWVAPAQVLATRDALRAARRKA